MSSQVILAGYLILMGGMALYEVIGIASHRTPTLGEAARLATKSRLGRWSMLAGWLWLGWHVFVRANWG